MCRHRPVTTSTISSPVRTLVRPRVTSMAAWRLSGPQTQFPRLMASGPVSAPGTRRRRSDPLMRSRTRSPGRLPETTSQTTLDPSGETASALDSPVSVTFSTVPPLYGTR
jgi:hypothetical protein